MGMNVSGGSALKSEINVPPLVDVVLVLLIIFMVVIPILQMGYPVNTPPENKNAQFVPPSADQLIVRMDRDGRTYLNKEEVPKAPFGARLKENPARRGAHIQHKGGGAKGALGGGLKENRRQPRQEDGVLRRRRRADLRRGRRVHG